MDEAVKTYSNDEINELAQNHLDQMQVGYAGEEVMQFPRNAGDIDTYWLLIYFMIFIQDFNCKIRMASKWKIAVT